MISCSGIVREGIRDIRDSKEASECLINEMKYSSHSLDKHKELLSKLNNNASYNIIDTDKQAINFFTSRIITSAGTYDKYARLTGDGGGESANGSGYSSGFSSTATVWYSGTPQRYANNPGEGYDIDVTSVSNIGSPTSRSPTGAASLGTFTSLASNSGSMSVSKTFTGGLADHGANFSVTVTDTFYTSESVSGTVTVQITDGLN